MPFYPPNPGSSPHRSYPGPHSAYSRPYGPYREPYVPFKSPYPPFAGPYHSYEQMHAPYRDYYPPGPVQPYRRRSGLKMEPDYFRESVNAWLPKTNTQQEMPKIWENINQIMANVGEITNGINALKQVGSLLNIRR